MPTFSVVVPIYKVEKYLNGCVDSLIHQTFSDFEIILVDDGSPDNCPEICDNYVKNYNFIRVIHKKNGGVVCARQAGVAIAVGKYIAFVDGDDWVADDYLENFANIIKKYNSPDVISCGYYEAYEDRNVEKYHKDKPGYYSRERIEQEIFPKLLCSIDGETFPQSLWAKVFKRPLYEKHQLVNCSIKMGEDDACTKPCIYYSENMFIIDKCLYYYRQNPISITKGKSPFPWDGPYLRGKHLERQIDMSDSDFQEQLYRSTARAVFTVAASQFRRNDPFNVVSKDIKLHLEMPYYADAIKKCKFRGRTIQHVALYALRYKWMLFFKVYCIKKL